MVLDLRDVEAVGVEDAPTGITDRHDPRTCVGEDPCSVPSRVPEALDRDVQSFDLREAWERPHLDHVLEHVEQALCRCRVPAERTAQVERLAGHDREVVLPWMHHRVGVVDPGHRLGVGVQVGCRDVGEGPDVIAEGGDEAAGEAPLLVLRQRLRVALDASLGTAEGDVREGALPRHEGGEGDHLVLVDVGVVADAALAGPADVVMEHPVALEDVDVPVVHLHGQAQPDDALGLEQQPCDAAEAVERMEERDGPIELTSGHVGEIETLGRIGHRNPYLASRHRTPGHRRREAGPKK